MNFTSLLLGEAVSEPSGMLDAKDGFGAWRQLASPTPTHTWEAGTQFKSMARQPLTHSFLNRTNEQGAYQG